MFISIDAELLEMIERADGDKDGEISPEEFYSIMVRSCCLAMHQCLYIYIYIFVFLQYLCIM